MTTYGVFFARVVTLYGGATVFYAVLCRAIDAAREINILAGQSRVWEVIFIQVSRHFVIFSYFENRLVPDYLDTL